jgi:hypothetical protein
METPVFYHGIIGECLPARLIGPSNDDAESLQSSGVALDVTEAMRSWPPQIASTSQLPVSAVRNTVGLLEEFGQSEHDFPNAIRPYSPLPNPPSTRVQVPTLQANKLVAKLRRRGKPGVFGEAEPLWSRQNHANRGGPHPKFVRTDPIPSEPLSIFSYSK